MCSTAEKRLIHNTNRIMVCGLSSTGMLMDGFQYWDVPYFFSLAMWLALPECGRYAELGLDKMRAAHKDWMAQRLHKEHTLESRMNT